MLDGGAVRHVGFHTDDLGSSTREPLHSGGERCAVDVGQNELHPMLGEQGAYGASNSPFATATSDGCNLVSQFLHRTLLRKPALITVARADDD